MTSFNKTQRFLPLCFAAVATVCLTGADWLQFRGTDISGVSLDSSIPATWSEDQNIAWKVDLPGRGLSCPIVIGDKVVVTASTGFHQNRLHILCFDRSSGETVWHRQFLATGRTMTHPKMCNATPTPASDGERIYAFFSSNDLACLDLDGNLLWYRGLTYDFPNASNSLGMSSSPIVVDDTLIVQVENDAESFATGIDVLTGVSRWKKDRPKKANWTSPTYSKNADGSSLALLQSSAGIEAVDPKSGETAWEYNDGASTIPSSVVSSDYVFIPSNGLTVLRTGDGNPSDVLWNENRLGPSTPSPVVVNGRVYVINRAGVLQAADMTTGNILWRLRLTGPFSATPIVAGKHMIVFNEKGSGQVVDISGEEGELVGTNELAETILGTPAVSGNEMFVRSDGHLWKIAAE